MNRAYTLGGLPYRAGIPADDDEQVEALKCIGRYSVEELHAILKKHEAEVEARVDRSVQHLMSDG